MSIDLILLVIFGVGAVIADIVSADRALYFRMQQHEGDEHERHHC